MLGHIFEIWPNTLQISQFIFSRSIQSRTSALPGDRTARTPSMVLGRRLFLRYAGFTAASPTLLIATCSKDPITTAITPQAVDLGTGDVCILNYASGRSSGVIAALNFALTLEYLEDEYYRTAISTSDLIPSADMAVISQISKHETAHVALLKGALGAAAVAKPAFKFGTVFSNYQTFLAAAQTFEDVGVRAYKGQAGALLGTDQLTVALQIHSVEARHAAEIRRLRGMRGWVTDGDTGPVYAGEEITSQAGVDLVALTGKSAVRSREAFDEPLTKEQVLALAAPYLA